MKPKRVGRVCLGVGVHFTEVAINDMRDIPAWPENINDIVAGVGAGVSGDTQIEMVKAVDDVGKSFGVSLPVLTVWVTVKHQ